MRTGGCSIQQSLTPEAATIVKQAINLARRRGHAQVTPIHVASVMLASPAGLLRAACLKSSHSHPFQCKALELCFNVALNRLPTTTGQLLGPSGPVGHYPALANALMAAFKRAQAHQRRGSIEAQQQQQPILALKIETEQLVVSILDDPSVSRVMREAGFSSTHVKANVEQQQQQTISPTSSSYNCTNNSSLIIPTQTRLNIAATIHYSELGFSSPVIPARSDDVSGVVEAWARRREKASLVLVGESMGGCEGVVRGLKERVEKGDKDVPLELRHVQFLNCPLASMKSLSREEIDLRLGEIRCLIKGCVGRGVVLYLGDLRWVAEYWAYYGDQRRHYYCPVEHLVMGLRRLVFGNVENYGRVWLMGIATFNTFIKCKSGNPSLETLLDLHAITVPAGSLDLSLNLDSSLVRNNESTTTTTTATTSVSSSLPSWLQKCKEESREEPSTNDQEETVQMKELCKKWNLICSNNTKPNKSTNFINFSSCSPSSSKSISSYESKPINWPTISFEATKEHQFLAVLPNNTDPPKPDLLSNPNSTPNSASSSETTEPIITTASFNDNNPENFEVLCSALERKVPWQREIIPEIASAILRCRSGKEERAHKRNKPKRETWLFFLGVDHEGKSRLAREIARTIFGSGQSRFKTIGLSSFASTKGDSTDNCSKRGRDECGGGYLERLAEEVKENPHRVFYVEDVEQLDERSQRGIKRAIESGKIVISRSEEVDLEDAIVIFSCESFSSGSRACSPPIRRKVEEEQKEERDQDLDYDVASSGPLPPSLDLNIAVDNDEEDNDTSENTLVGGVRILEAVDKQVFFKIQML